MDLKLDYGMVWNHFNRSMAQVIAQLRAGKSRDKEAAPSDLKWSLSWGIRLGGRNMCAESFKDEEHYVSEMRKRVHVTLRGGVRRWWGYSEPLQYFPKQLEEFYRAEYKRQMERHAAYQALSQEQKDKQAAEALKYLMGQPGFVALSVKKDTIKKLQSRLIKP